MLAVQGPPAEPVRSVDAVGGPGLAGEQPVGAGLREQGEPELVVVRGAAQPGGHDLQQPAAQFGSLLGEDDERGPVEVPEGGGGAHRRGRGEEVGDEGALLAAPVQPRRLDQRARVLRQGRVWRHAGGAALHGELPELRPCLGRRETRREGLDVFLERLDRQRAGEGELQEDGPLPLLVHGQGVHPLRVAGLAEEGRRVGGVLVLQEDAGGLLVEGGQEVRHGAAELLAECLEALLGGAGAGLGLPGEPLDVPDQRQRVVTVRRVVDQRPGGEAEGLPADLADLAGLGLAGQSEEVQGEVLRLAEGAGHQPDDLPLVQRGVRVGADGEDVGVLPVRDARGQHGAGVEQRGRGGLVVGETVVLVRRHAARSSSSMSRPAYSAAAMRIPSDQATGPT